MKTTRTQRDNMAAAIKRFKTSIEVCDKKDFYTTWEDMQENREAHVAYKQLVTMDTVLDLIEDLNTQEDTEPQYHD